MKITAIIEAVPGDKVMVENYRSRYKPWENGTIHATKIGVNKDGVCRVAYDVMLDRRGNGRYGNRPIWLYVGDDKIRKI